MAISAIRPIKLFTDDLDAMEKTVVRYSRAIWFEGLRINRIGVCWVGRRKRPSRRFFSPNEVLASSVLFTRKFKYGSGLNDANLNLPFRLRRNTPPCLSLQKKIYRDS